MKKNRSYIISAWLLLVFFVGGQVILFAHQHRINQWERQTFRQSSHSLPPRILTEKCSICDALHFNYMLLHQQVHFQPLTTSVYFYTPGAYNFTSISLVFAAGRAPPYQPLT